MSGKVEVKDRGWDRINKMAHTIESRHVAVGVLGKNAPRQEGGEFNNAAVAAVHEFGSEDGRIPERSFIRSTVDANQSKYRVAAKRFMDLVVTGKMAMDKALGKFGSLIKADIQATIVKGIPPPLSEATIDARERKKRMSTKPLVDTGQLKGSIDYEVRNEGVL
jgi:hypothetical protein